MRLILMTIVMSLAAAPSFATESAQSLLRELISPLTPELQQSSAPSLVQHDSESMQQLQDGSELFTLEELNEPADKKSVELTLPDAELPLADIPLTTNSKVDYFLSYFQTRGRESFSRWLARSSRYIPMMREILKKENLPEDLVFVAMIESGFQLHAKSFANAVGPWQFISDTGKRFSLRIDQWIDERKDPVKATAAAGHYLKELYTLFNGDWYLAAAGYNAGENKILRAITKYNTTDFWEMSQGSYLAKETKDYVPKLLAAATIAKDPARFGFSDIAYLPPIEFDTVKIPSRTDLELIASLTGTSYATIKELNPELRHWCTPPNYPDYEIKIPKGTKEAFLDKYLKIPEENRFTEKMLYTRYKGKKGDTLAKIARKFGTTQEVIAELNSLSKNTPLKGRVLAVPAKRSVDFINEGRTASTTALSKGKFAKYYTVKRGDTVASISKRFNVPQKLLASWNRIKSSVALKPGKRIIVAKFSETNGELKQSTPVPES